jgi:hypothetical protein
MHSRGSFGYLSSLWNLMQVNRSHAHILVGKLLVGGILRELPRAMDVIRAKMEHHAPGVIGSGFNTISSQRWTGLVACDQPKTTKRNRSWHEL